ncbi:hypothetical protein LZ198_24370 [Myxococcus sp. K15C18031901]|uniref:hypothetical protein n=1 Tax=Myxococcus dinghuensis TaxID=2906761 RepID=UPI0020A831A3|nr:hypothetical protein [Myxococcus dinghuensis]MCP3102006.1 hypothetical protein [Myxococcus dinghuensis]
MSRAAWMWLLVAVAGAMPASARAAAVGDGSLSPRRDALATPPVPGLSEPGRPDLAASSRSSLREPARRDLTAPSVLAQQQARPGSDTPPPPPLPAKPPARGESHRPAPQLSEEDREVVEELELLESMDAAEDLEVLLELSAQD